MPNTAENTVLHVLPHPGGGGETYVDLLDDMPGYRFERMYLGSSASPGVSEVARGLAAVAKSARRHDLLHVHGEVAAGMCLPLLAGRPSVVTSHGLHFIRRLGGAPRTAAQLNIRAVLRAASRTICVSESEHDELVRAVGASAARRAVVVRNGVDVPTPASDGERAAVRESLGIGISEPVAIWVGSLDERKDPLAAVSAAQEASLKLLVVGDGPLRDVVQGAAGEYVLVLGSRGDVRNLIVAADAFVLTSHREGLSFSLLEAMACGLAPVVSRLPENVEAVGDAGIVAPLGDRAALVAALRRMATEEDVRATLGARARERVRESFARDSMLDKTIAVYDEVFARRDRRSGSATASS